MTSTNHTASRPFFLPRLQRMTLSMFALLLLGACVTVNIYFPAAEVEKAAEDIVQDVYSNDQQGGADESSCLQIFVALAEQLGPATAHAADAKTVSNAAIRNLKQQIVENYKQMKPFYESGNLGIDSKGLLEIRNTDGLNIQQVAQLKRLVSSDNKARQQLYAEVAKALGVESSQVSKVQDIFAQEWQSKAPAGYWIQQSGGWRQK